MCLPTGFASKMETQGHSLTGPETTFFLDIVSGPVGGRLIEKHVAFKQILCNSTHFSMGRVNILHFLNVFHAILLILPWGGERTLPF